MVSCKENFASYAEKKSKPKIFWAAFVCLHIPIREQFPSGEGRRAAPFFMVIMQELLTGQTLRDELSKEDLGHQPLIEELVFTNTVNAFVSQPGVGKSVLTANLTASASIGGLCFGLLKCAKALKIAYLQMEGDRSEQLSRLKAMESEIPFDVNNIGWFTPFVIAEKQETWPELFIELDQFKPFDLLIVDPIYKMTMYGLTKEESVLALIKLLDKIKRDYQCAMILNHHTTKDSYDFKGDKIKKDDPFYGSQWLKAFVDSSYIIERINDENIRLKRTKSRASNSIESLVLSFDIATWTLSTNVNYSTSTARVKVRNYLEKELPNGTLKSHDICRATKISQRHLRRLKNDGEFNDLCSFKDEIGKDTEWRSKTPSEFS